MINTFGQEKVIIDMVVYHYSISKLIITNWSLLFISNFWFSLCYFLGIKKRLFIAFHLPIDGQIKRQNSMTEVYFRVFVS